MKLSTEQTNTLAIVLGSLLSVLAVLAAAVLIVLLKVKSRKTVPQVELVDSQDQTKVDITSNSVQVQTIK
jgi:type IV secretory pathway component VirB8